MWPIRKGRITGRGAFDPSTAPASVIKMIQQGTITIASGAASGTYTISPTITDTSKAILVWNGINTANSTTGLDTRDAVRIAITNSSTITATRGASPAFALTVNFTIVEFVSGVNSIQAGTISIASGSGSTNTATISAVGANAFVIYQGFSLPSTLGSTVPLASVALTNPTTVTATVWASASVTQTVGYMVVDLDTTIVSAIEQKAVSMTSANASDTDTITSVTTGNTLLMWGGMTSQAAVATTGQYSTYLGAATTVTKTRVGIVATARVVNYTVVSLNPSALNGSVQRSSTFALASQASNTAAISSVDTTKSFVNWSGFSAAAGNPNVTVPAISLSGATSVQGTLSSSGSATVPFEVVQFA